MTSTSSTTTSSTLSIKVNVVNVSSNMIKPTSSEPMVVNRYYCCEQTNLLSPVSFSGLQDLIITSGKSPRLNLFRKNFVLFFNFLKNDKRISEILKFFLNGLQSEKGFFSC